MASHTRLVTPVPALESLRRDHQALLLLADALDAYAAALEARRPVHPGDLRALVHALRTFGDYRHFEKEEQVLVPLLVRAGFDFALGVFAEGRHAHQRLRHLIEVLEYAAQRELDWSRFEQTAIVAAARALTDAQRRISDRQERELLPEIAKRLDGPALELLNRELLRFDERDAARSSGFDVWRVGRETLERYGAASLPASNQNLAASNTRG